MLIIIVNLIYIEEQKREWKKMYPDFEENVLSMFDMPNQYHKSGKNGSFICTSSQTEGFNNAENFLQAHYELQSFHGTQDVDNHKQITFKIEILKSVRFDKGGILTICGRNFTLIKYF